MVSPPASGAAERPLVTLFVTGYEQAATIREAVEGAFAQTWTPLEIILADDGSRDATHAIMQEMAAAYDGPHAVRVLRTARNRGVAGNVNHVMAHARGELIVMAGGDDVSRPDRVERLAGAWLDADRRAHLIHSAAEVIDEAGRVIGRRDGVPAIVADPSPRRVLAARHSLLGASLAWSRELFEVFGPLPDDALVEDVVITFRGAFLGPILYVDAPLVRWRTGGVSWTPPHLRGRDQLYGPELKFARWRAAGCRVALREMERVDFPERETCRALAREQAERLGLVVALAEAGPLARLGLMPRAAALSARRRSPGLMKQALKYLFDGLYMRYWQARYGTRATGAP
jgi:hypothetical protein